MSPVEYFKDWCKVVDISVVNSIIAALIKERIPTCPKIKDAFKAFEYCDYNNLRCVILGQDPYPQVVNNQPVATGIAFANNITTDISDYSPSLKVLKESVIDFSVPHNIITFDPSLKKWEEQGVLMLNTALTCRVNSIGSHTLLWRPFIVSLLENLSRNLTGIVYVLLGSNAQSYKMYINSKFNYILEDKHPSYYARTNTTMPSSLWYKINEVLIKLNGYGIEWYAETK